MTRALRGSGALVSLALLIVGAAGCVERLPSTVCNEVTEEMCLSLRLTGEMGQVDELSIAALAQQSAGGVDHLVWLTGLSMKVASPLPVEVPITWELAAPFTAPDLDIVVRARVGGTTVGFTSFGVYSVKKGKTELVAPLRPLSDSLCYNQNEDTAETGIDCGADGFSTSQYAVAGYSPGLVVKKDLCVPCAKGVSCYLDRNCASSVCDTDSFTCK